MEINKREANMQIGRRLRKARTDMDRTRSDFAEALHVSEKHYCSLEAGTSELSAEKLLVLCQAYGIDPTYLVTGISSKRSKPVISCFAADSQEEQKNRFSKRMTAYLSKLAE